MRTLFGIKRGTPFLKRIIAVSGWPLRAAMCINVLPSLVRSKTDALNLSAKNSTIEVCPLSAARCMGVRSMKLTCNRIQKSYITIIGLPYFISSNWDLYLYCMPTKRLEQILLIFDITTFFASCGAQITSISIGRCYPCTTKALQ